MKYLNKRHLSILVAVIISATLSAGVTVNRMQANASIDSINALLYDLDNELEIMIHLSEKYASDSYVRKKAESLVISKFLAMSTTQPDIKKLHGVPLDAVYRAINYLKEYEWDSKEGRETFSTVRTYIHEIENVVTELKTKKDEIFRKPLK